jgi:hypothetical protein
MPWQFSHEDETYNEDDVTLGQWDRLEKLLDKSWHRIDPRFSAADAKAILRTLIADRTGRDEDTVGAEVDAINTREFLGMFRVVESDLPEEYTDGIPH